MELRTVYKFILTGRFRDFCDKNDIDLKNTDVQIKHFSKTIFQRESRLVVDMESFLMNKIQNLVFDFYIKGWDDNLLSSGYCIRIRDINGKYHELF